MEAEVIEMFEHMKKTAVCDEVPAALLTLAWVLRKHGVAGDRGDTPYDVIIHDDSSNQDTSN